MVKTIEFEVYGTMTDIERAIKAFRSQANADVYIDTHGTGQLLLETLRERGVDVEPKK